MDEPAIIVESVSKAFKLPHERQGSIKGLFVNMFRGRRTYETQRVLKDLSFKINKGEFFGIVGRNGSGKSTLLKLLAGIYAQDQGHIKVNGKLTPFIELGVGFNPELTGRENVFLNGALLGFNRKEMHAMYREIVEFAELEKFMDQKLKNYSSGMQVRLAFSIAIRAKSDILLIDEVLAVGDYAFQQKCYEYFKHLQSMNKTVVFVSHDVNALQTYCSKGILVEDGKIVKEAAISDIVDLYNKINIQKLNNFHKGKTSDTPANTENSGLLSVSRVYSTDKSGQPKNAFAPNEAINICYEIKPNQNLDNPTIGLVLRDGSGRALFATNTLDTGISTGVLKAGKKTTVVFSLENVFDDGQLFVSGAVASHDRKDLYYRFQNGHHFASVGWTTSAKGLVYLPYEFSVKK